MSDYKKYNVLGGISATEQEIVDCVEWLRDKRGGLFFKELKNCEAQYEEQTLIDNKVKGQSLDEFYRNKDINAVRLNLIRYIMHIADRLVIEVKEIQDADKQD